MPLADPWIAATTMALRTERITIGPLVTPLPRRRPWQVARQAVTLDHLSGGRLVLGIGLGGDWHGEYLGFGEPGSTKQRGAMLDEAIEVIAGLWTGEPFTFHGDHYQVDDVQFLPTPLQQPRIPVWVAGVWPNKAPFRRAARWDGVFPIIERDSFAVDPNEIREILKYIAEFRQSDSAPRRHRSRRVTRRARRCAARQYRGPCGNRCDVVAADGRPRRAIRDDTGLDRCWATSLKLTPAFFSIGRSSGVGANSSYASRGPHAGSIDDLLVSLALPIIPSLSRDLEGDDVPIVPRCRREPCHVLGGQGYLVPALPSRFLDKLGMTGTAGATSFPC